MFKELIVETHTMPSFGGLGIVIYGEGHDGNFYMAKPMDLDFKRIEANAWISEPTLKFSRGPDARAFLAAMVKCAEKQGLMADKVKVQQNELTVTREWLEDMRALVFKKDPK